jgi:hypothetical protein
LDGVPSAGTASITLGTYSHAIFRLREEEAAKIAG